MKNFFDVIVIGGGIAGVSVACELADKLKVLILEAEDHIGYHATGRSAAFFAPAYGNRVVREITSWSEMFYRQPPAQFSDASLLNPRDCIFIAREDQQTVLSKMHSELNSSLSLLSSEEVSSRVPILKPGYVHGGLLSMDGGDLDVDAILQGYLRLFRKRGGRLITAARVMSLQYADKQWQVFTQNESYQAPILVNAAGAWADEIGKLAKLGPLGLTPMRRSALLIDLPGEMDVSGWPLIVDIEEKFYFKPEAGKLLISPCDETPSQACDAQPEELDIAIGVDRFEQATNINVDRVTHKWAGLRTFSEDRAPVAGFDPRLHGFFWLAGQGGYGVQTAPGLARLSRYLLTQETVASQDAALMSLSQSLEAERLLTNRE